MRQIYEGKLEELQDVDDQVGECVERLAADRPAQEDVDLLRL